MLKMILFIIAFWTSDDNKSSIFFTFNYEKCYIWSCAVNSLLLFWKCAYAIVGDLEVGQCNVFKMYGILKVLLIVLYLLEDTNFYPSFVPLIVPSRNYKFTTTFVLIFAKIRSLSWITEY